MAMQNIQMWIQDECNGNCSYGDREVGIFLILFFLKDWNISPNFINPAFAKYFLTQSFCSTYF